MISSRITKKTREAIYRRDGWACALCNDTHGLQVHHLHPRSLGGADHTMNLITLCMYCHMAIHHNALDAKNKEERDYWYEWTKQEAHEYLADYYAPDWYPWDG